MNNHPIKPEDVAKYELKNTKTLLWAAQKEVDELKQKLADARRAGQEEMRERAAQVIRDFCYVITTVKDPKIRSVVNQEATTEGMVAAILALPLKEHPR